MFWIMSFILLLLWCLGVASGAHTGMWIHLLLAFAVGTLVLAAASSARAARR